MEEAEYVTAIDLAVNIEEKDGKRSISWFPNFRIIDTATVTPDPETQAQVDAYNAELDKDLTSPSAPRRSPSTAASRSCAPGRRPSATSSPMRCAMR